MAVKECCRGDNYGYENILENDEQTLIKAVANQPVSASIDAGGKEFQLYSEVPFILYSYET